MSRPRWLRLSALFAGGLAGTFMALGAVSVPMNSGIAWEHRMLTVLYWSLVGGILGRSWMDARPVFGNGPLVRDPSSGSHCSYRHISKCARRNEPQVFNLDCVADRHGAFAGIGVAWLPRE
jgi:hypothetical protein